MSPRTFLYAEYSRRFSCLLSSSSWKVRLEALQLFNEIFIWNETPPSDSPGHLCFVLPPPSPADLGHWLALCGTLSTEPHPCVRQEALRTFKFILEQWDTHIVRIFPHGVALGEPEAQDAAHWFRAQEGVAGQPWAWFCFAAMS